MDTGEIVSVAIASVAAAFAGVAWKVAKAAEDRTQQAQLTVENTISSANGQGWEVTLTNTGYGSARHVAVQLVDASGREVGRSGDPASGDFGPALHPRHRVTLTSRFDERAAGVPSPEYPLTVWAEWKHWKRDEREKHESSWQIKSPSRQDPSP